MDRSLQLPKIVRRALITLFCEATEPKDLLNSPAGKRLSTWELCSRLCSAVEIPWSMNLVIL